MTSWWLRLLLVLYPPGWRRSHGTELTRLLAEVKTDQGRVPLKMSFNLLLNAVPLRMRYAPFKTAASGLGVIAAVAAITVLLILPSFGAAAPPNDFPGRIAENVPLSVGNSSTDDPVPHATFAWRETIGPNGKHQRQLIVVPNNSVTSDNLAAWLTTHGYSPQTKASTG